MKTNCLNCNTEIKNGSYCSNICQQKFQNLKRIEHWLKTGECKPRSSGYIKDYLMKIQNSKCKICNISNTWNVSSLNFIIDHINGNSEDNSFQNLRLVCPNCDSQLPTFKSRNRGNGRTYRRLRYSQGKTY